MTVNDVSMTQPEPAEGFPDFRTGIGFDAHTLEVGRRLVLGGVDIPHTHGLVGHSDGDVLIHSIMDALLGASALGDKGVHFPSSDRLYEGISSLILLSKVGQLVHDAGWRISNVDATLLAQKPRLGSFIQSMRQQTGAALSLSIGRISIKVTTTDYMGFTGREEGIAACAVALVVSRLAF